MRTCLECNEPIVGRVDKKFCSELCRNAYNNNRSITDNKKVNNVNTILKKNREILKGMILKNVTEITSNLLLSEGFNFYYITSFEYNTNKSCCYFCYEYGYYPVEDNCFRLLKRQTAENEQ